MRDEHQRQAASNVTVRNVITSMCSISAIDWADMFESVSLVDAALRASTDFAQMDFPTRDRYRRAIEELARGSKHSEPEIAQRAVLTANRGTCARERDPGYPLFAGGRAAFEAALGDGSRRAPGSAALASGGIEWYIAGVTVLAAVILGLPSTAGAGASRGIRRVPAAARDSWHRAGVRRPWRW